MANPIKPKKYVNLQDTLKNKTVRFRNNVNEGTRGILTANVGGNGKVFLDVEIDATSGQEWIVYPLGDGIYMLVNCDTGTVLTSNVPDPWGNANMSVTDYKGDATQQFTLETTDNISMYSIRSLDDGGIFSVFTDINSWSIEVLNDINIYDINTYNKDNPVATLDPFPVYANLEDKLPKTTPDRLISYTLIPAPAVQDGELTLKQKVQNSPYYLMEKHQYWTQLYQLSLAPGEKREKEYDYGMDTTKVNEMTTTTGMSIQQDSGVNFSLGGIFGGSASIRKEITDNLMVHESVSSKVSSRVTDTSTFDNSNNQYTMYYAKYILTTTLVLQRFGSNKDLNKTIGTESWSFSDQNTVRTTSWIPDANPADCSDCFDGVDCSDCPDCPQCQDE